MNSYLQGLLAYGMRNGSFNLSMQVIILQSLTGLFYLIAPIVVVLTYHFTPEVSMLPGEKTLPESEDKLVHTLEEHVNPRPCTDDNQHVRIPLN